MNKVGARENVCVGIRGWRTTRPIGKSGMKYVYLPLEMRNLESTSVLHEGGRRFCPLLIKLHGSPVMYLVFCDVRNRVRLLLRSEGPITPG